MNNLYEIRENKFGRFFIKNNQYWYLDQLEVFGLDTSLRYDTIEYNFYKVEFIEKDNKEYIKCRKTIRIMFKYTRLLEWLCYKSLL